jgi:hypothetical protein
MAIFEIFIVNFYHWLVFNLANNYNAFFEDQAIVRNILLSTIFVIK